MAMRLERREGRPWDEGGPGVVLVPLDGSSTAEAALGHAATVAARAGATLHLAGVVPVDEAKLDLGTGVEIAQPGSREYPRFMDEYVTRIAARTAKRHGCLVEPTVLDAADPADGLGEYARRIRVDLAVVGVSVPAAQERVEPPGLSRAATWDAPSPLLLLPVTAADGERRPVHGPRPRPRIVAIVAPTMGRHDSVVELGAGYAQLWGSGVRLIDAAPLQHRLHDAGSRLHEGAEDGARGERLLELTGMLREEGLSTVARSLDGADAESELLGVLAAERVDTVVASHAARPLAERLLFGSRGRREAPREASVVGQVAVLISPR